MQPAVDKCDDDQDTLASGLAGLFDQHRSELRRFIRAQCRDEASVDDVMQELWLKLARAKPGPITNGRSYLFRMANNLILDNRRSRQRAMVRDKQWIDAASGPGSTLADRPDPSPSAEDVIISEQEYATLHRSIASLSPRAQQALVLHRLEGLGQAEVARIMGISRRGVEKNLALAMKHLRDGLANYGLLPTVTSFPEEITQEAECSQSEEQP